MVAEMGTLRGLSRRSSSRPGRGTHVAPGITLVVVGAILAFAVRTDGTVVNIHMVGVIFMLAGAAIIYYYSRERHRKQVVTRVQYHDGEAEPAETVRETVTRETVYEGDEPPPATEPPVQRQVHGVNGF
jgi:hypothetical protein